MEIYQLKAFLEVARHGNLTRAAEQLHLTQSAVSKQIKALEQVLGLSLFARQASGMVLTTAGRELFPKAEQTLISAVDLMNHSRTLRGGEAGQVALGTIIDPVTLRLGSFLSALIANFPRLQVRFMHGISGWVIEKLKNQEIDAGFFLGPVQDEAIQAIGLRSLDYVVVGPASWSDRLDSAHWEDIAAMPWIGAPMQSSQHALVRNMFATRGLAFRTVIEADQESTLVDLVRGGAGVAMMREDRALAAQARGDLAAWHGTRQPCPLSFVFLKQRRDDAMVVACCGALTSAWPSE